ncbi:MAG: type VI secretion system accessory protein TagJ [Pirellulaceae bacterium]
MTTLTTNFADTLEQTLENVKNQVRKQPADINHRLFLFQLMAVMGQWSKSHTQLKVCGEMDPANLALMHVYNEALQCEAFRAEVFSGHVRPLVFGKPQPWIASLLEALRLEDAGQHAAGQRLRESAFDDAKPTAGSITTRSGAQLEFTWISDADQRLGPVLEAIVGGKYYWVAWENIRAIELQDVTDLRDLVWQPVYFTWANGGQSPGFIPTRYVGTEAAADDDLRMSRKTIWKPTEGGAYAGLGQRMFATDADDVALLDVAQISLRVEGQTETESHAQLPGTNDTHTDTPACAINTASFNLAAKL